ncbi:MAG: RNA polymerase sigma factor [Phycisphaerae bacterium]
MPSVGIGIASGFEQYGRDVYAWAYRLLGCHHDALDVVQDVFIKWGAQCAKAEPRRPRGWLRRVTLNRSVDLIRHRGAAPDRAADQLDAVARGPVAGDTPIDPLDQAALCRDVAAALGRLSEVQRGVLVAKVYDGMTFSNIADELDVSVSTVKTHYLRAITAVRDRLEHRWGRPDA